MEDCKRCHGYKGWFRGPVGQEKPNKGGYVWQICPDCSGPAEDLTRQSV